MVESTGISLAEMDS